jgi:hypothetical protein
MGECAHSGSEGRWNNGRHSRIAASHQCASRTLSSQQHYVVRDTLTLKRDTVLIGLHPTLTQIDLLDEAPEFQGVGAPKAVLLAPPGGKNIVSGIGVFAGGINPRAVAILWKSGEQSLIDDVRFLGGHGSGGNPYNNNHTADSDLHKRWDGQYPSPLGYRWRRRNIRRHLDAQYVCAVRLSGIEHEDVWATCTSCPTSTTYGTRSSWITSRTGISTRYRPKRRPGRALNRFRWRLRTAAISPSRTITAIA